jgi:hypothetical protein
MSAIYQLQDWFEAVWIRVLWVGHSISLKKMPGLCPPACSEGHTYKFPCRARLQVARYAASTQYSHYDEPIGKITLVTETEDGIRIEGTLTDLGRTLNLFGGGFTISEDDPEPQRQSNPNLDKVSLKVCGASKAGAYGQAWNTCVFWIDHEGPHSWVATT